ncbi:cell division protein FtsL [Moraxella haemolytica]|uniref:cell division protein FtsL n=1 Tax=Moraxella TaxID=475 RepID=UPI00254387FC|nr:cell division protein FtsL [Moraxella sp. ZY171148]WII95089.1 cell division protein FtsL [Moraxella sp. ZY171148]
MNNKLAHFTQSQATTDEAVSMVGLYRLFLGVLLVAIMWTGVSISAQTQEHHATYRYLKQLKSELTAMQVEEQRLLIEQQTFSATPQVASRAVSELGMFFPTGDHRRVIAPNRPNGVQPNATKVVQ